MTIFKDKTITDNFIFGAVMQNPKLCKALLECILNIKIREIKYPELEKTISKGVGSKSVRLDVYIEDEFDTIYNIEMQTTNKKNLPKRMRYYQGIIDINIIDKGEDYNKLKKSYVIFICDYDEFGIGRHIYTFENTCIQEPALKLNDDTVKIILNTKGTMDDVSDEVKELLHYYGQDTHYETVKEWYDGYRFGNVDVYCPWDVINYCSDHIANQECAPKNYWVNTSGNDVIHRFINSIYEPQKL